MKSENELNKSKSSNQKLRHKSNLFVHRKFSTKGKALKDIWFHKLYLQIKKYVKCKKKPPTPPRPCFPKIDEVSLSKTELFNLETKSSNRRGLRASKQSRFLSKAIRDEGSESFNIWKKGSVSSHNTHNLIDISVRNVLKTKRFRNFRASHRVRFEQSIQESKRWRRRATQARLKQGKIGLLTRNLISPSHSRGQVQKLIDKFKENFNKHHKRRSKEMVGKNGLRILRAQNSGLRIRERNRHQSLNNKTKSNQQIPDKKISVHILRKHIMETYRRKSGRRTKSFMFYKKDSESTSMVNVLDENIKNPNRKLGKGKSSIFIYNLLLLSML